MPILRNPLTSFLTSCVALGSMSLAKHMTCAQSPAATADTKVRVAKWKDDRTAVFLLMFDDSWPSHWHVAGPELAKRGMTATFYICPGKGEHQKFSKEWNETMWKQGMVYGNHTMTHKGVKDLEGAEWEIGECARVIREIVPGKPDRLVSYGQPGVGPNDWNISEEQLAVLLKKYNLISRPTFVGHGAMYHVKTAPEMLALADKAIAGGGMEYLVVHGVERITPNWGYQDMWPVKQEMLFTLFDGLKERRDAGKLWITDHISYHQYDTERSTAEVRVLERSEARLKVSLTCKADPKFYDLPLTLVVEAPAGWKHASVTQGATITSAVVENGSIRFDAVPSNAAITIERAAEK